MIRLATKEELKHIENDPVRPHLKTDWRTRSGREVYVLEREGEIAAVICVAFMDEVPQSEYDMRWPGMSHAIFYTVWSYQKGAGRQIINQAQMHLHKKFGNKIKKYVTLSPLTRVAERFHLRNGAILLQKGEKCQNFEYSLPKE